MEEAHKVGFHASGEEEFSRVARIKGVNLIELKPGKFAKEGNPLYIYDGNTFEINHRVVEELERFAKTRDIALQIHLPYERSHNPKKESGLCASDRAHHDRLLQRFDMIGQMHERYGVGNVVTIHPPAYMFDGTEKWTKEEALDAGREFYSRVDALMKEKGYSFRIGLENMVLPKNGEGARGTSSLGYVPWHIDDIIGDTSKIGITIDSGHRRLNDEMSIAKLVSYGEVVNLHLHSNEGEDNPTDYSGDQHMIAIPGFDTEKELAQDLYRGFRFDDRFKVLPHFDNFVSRVIRRRKVPVVLEVKIREYNDEELVRYVSALRQDIGN